MLALKQSGVMGGKPLLELVAVLATALLAPLAAQAQSASVPIRACPATISTRGSYVLAQDLTCPPGSGITIAADSVSFNLGGHSLTGTDSYGHGITVEGTAEDPIIGLEIRTGVIRNFTVGLSVAHAPGALIDSVTATGSGIYGNEAGLRVTDSAGVRVRAVTATGVQFGIVVERSPGAQVQGSFTSGNRFNGLVTSGCDGCALLGNRSYRNQGYGIVVQGSKGARIVHSMVLGNGTADLLDDIPGTFGCRNIWRLNRFVTDSEGDGPGRGCIR